MQKNFLMLVADQHRADALGCAGKYGIKTPNLDCLAQNGVYFKNAFTPLPVCAPARQSMLCGRNPDSFGAYWNHGFFDAGSIEPSGWWPELLAASGMNTAFVGKWGATKKTGPCDFGYKKYIPLDGHAAMVKEKYPEYRGGGWFGKKSELPLTDSKTHWLAARACECMEEFAQSRQPWHIRVDYTDPHLPNEPSEPFASMYAPGDIVPWDGVGDTFEGKPYIQKQQLYTWGIENETWESWSKSVARYYGMVSQIDDSVGLMLKKLEETGQLENTVILYTADHGDMCGSHGMLDKHYVLFDDVIKVPMIFCGPGIEKGRIEESFVSCGIDLPPTIGDLLGISPPPAHGKSLAPFLCGETPQGWRAEITASSNGQQFGFFCQRALRGERYKYIWNMTDIDELYDMRTDPGEKKNLIYSPEHTELISDMRKRLLAVLKEQNDVFAAKGWLDRQLAENKKV